MDFNKLIIKGMNENNLQNLDLEIPKNKITVFTGVSGSGKSSIVFDTIAHEASRQMNQTYSSFIQTFLPKYSKPNVISIENLNPALIVDQKPMGGNSRSTLGTISDISSFLRPLFSRIGKPYSGPAHSFSFNDPLGMCPDCSGIGKETTIQVDKIIDMSKSLNDDAIIFPAFAKGGWYFTIYEASGFFDLDKVLSDYDDETLQLLLYGEKQKIKVPHIGGKTMNTDYEGIINKFKRMYIDRDLSGHSEKTQGVIDEYTYQATCNSCHGLRYNEEKRSCLINGESIASVGDMELGSLKEYLLSIEDISVQPVIDEAVKRIDLLINMSLDYLSLNRETSTLSGGESQRVKMMKHMSSALTGMLYIFDEPSVGLHPRDVHNLNRMLEHLRDLGNTVLVVEHDRDVILAADHIVDVGPKAGVYGGHIMFEGSVEGLFKSDTITGKSLNNLPDIKQNVRSFTEVLSIQNANTNNLKNISVDFPVGVLTAVTGVAGSGKSSLINEEFLRQYPDSIVIDQRALHATRRSNIATYTGIFDRIRTLFAKENNVNKSLFSFNSKGGCPECKGNGVVFTDLAYLEGVESVCPKCHGDRYLSEVLEMTYKDKNIMDVLDLSLDQAIEFFEDKSIVTTLQTLIDVGVSYLTLGQPLDTLSGGECQRIKLASELHKKGEIYILDEPTTGLHMADIEVLMSILNKLVDNGSTVIVIEHNIELMRQSDYLIDLGPGAGHLGGTLVYSGIPKGIINVEDSLTAKFAFNDIRK